jgi:hypothetical protein
MEYHNIIRVDESDSGSVAIAFTLNAWEIKDGDLLIKEWGSVIGQVIKSLAKTMGEGGINPEIAEMKLLQAINHSMYSINEPPIRPGEPVPGDED